MAETVVRPYVPDDLPACLAIFDSNLPTFFSAAEREEFRLFLQDAGAENSLYLVLAQGNVVLACGGLSILPDGLAHLSWGMVDRAHHGQGLGTRLTLARLALARATPGLTQIALATSQHTRRFYEGMGFTALKVTPDGFGPNLDRCDMILRL